MGERYWIGAVVFLLLIPVLCFAQDRPELFLDFDDDGVEDGAVVDRIDLTGPQTYTLYIGVDPHGLDWNSVEFDIEIDGYLYSWNFTSMMAFYLGDLGDGGVFMTGPCAGTDRLFIGYITGTVSDGGSVTFRLKRTSFPYAFPEKFHVYDCSESALHLCCNLANAGINTNPPDPYGCPVFATPGQLSHTSPIESPSWSL